MKLPRLVFAILSIVCLTAPAVWAQDDEAEEPIAQAIAVEGTPADKVDSKVRPLTVSVELLGGARLNGTLVDSSSLAMKTSFGEAGIPLAEVAGIRLPSGEDVSTTVVMLNGDSITGATDLKQITIDTEWGSARINGTAVQSLLFVPNVQWNAGNNLSGKRWTLSDVEPATAAQNTAPTQASTSRPAQLPPTARSVQQPPYRIVQRRDRESVNANFRLRASDEI